MTGKFQSVRSIRPDTTILGKEDVPVAFIEFRRDHLSDKVERVARDRGIPLFVSTLGYF